MANLTNTRRGGFYWKDNEPYLSVTTILQCIDRPALRYWYGQEVYRALLLEPELSEKDALAAPYQTSKKAKSRGSTVHSIIEAYKGTGERIEDMPRQYQGYAMAFYDFMRDHKPEIIVQEKSVFDETEKIAGTLDMYAKLGDRYMIIDIKTGKDIYQEAGLQMSAYRFMLENSESRVDDIAVLLLETGKDGFPTGKYKFQTMQYDIDAFLAAKKLYCYLNYERLLKAGYIKE